MTCEGRGAYCTVAPYHRGERDYYFAYPQDHRQTSIEYTEGQMTRRPYNPAFEIVLAPCLVRFDTRSLSRPR